MLKYLVSCPTILATFTEMNLFPVGKNLAFATVQTPNKYDLMLTTTTSCTCQTLLKCPVAGNSKFESDLFLAKTEGLASVFHPMVDLIRNKRGHVYWCIDKSIELSHRLLTLRIQASKVP